METARVTLKKYLPEEFVPYILELIRQHPVHFRITKPRNTKFGDFRAKTGSMPQITVNGNLNKYAFLITCLHEFAHLITHKEHGWNVSPHGAHWKQNFRSLLLPIIDSRTLPDDIQQSLMYSLRKVKASSCSDKDLYRSLLRYDSVKQGEILLEQLAQNSHFYLNGMLFQKGKLRRTRYICHEKTSQRMYLVSALALVKIADNEE